MQVLHILFHCTTERGLCVARKSVCLVDDNDLEAVRSVLVHLLRLCNFFEDVLDDKPIIRARVAG